MKIRNFDTVLRSFPRKGDPLDFEGTWREEAVRAHLIPIYSSFDTYYALTDDGNIVYCFGSWEEAQTITNTRYRHIALAQAAAQYQELCEIRPVRQADDPACRSCGGTGLVRVGDKTYDEFICECGGLGWYPKNSVLDPI